MLRLVLLVGYLGVVPSALNPPEEWSREWCATEAATDGQLEGCAAEYPDMYPTEEEWLKEQGCRLERPGEEDDADDIICEEE